MAGTVSIGSSSPPIGTPTESTIHEDTSADTGHSSSLKVPWPGSTYIIRCISSFSFGHVLTLLNGQVVLTPSNDRGAQYWDCMEKGGFLGLRNTASGQYLGFMKGGNLGCSSGSYDKEANICVRVRPEGGCVLLVQQGDFLHPLCLKSGLNETTLVKTGRDEPTQTVFEFIKI